MAKLNFSQMHGLADMPAPLGVGELSNKARNKIWSLLYATMAEEQHFDSRRRCSVVGFYWAPVTQALHVDFFCEPLDEYDPSFQHHVSIIKEWILQKPYNEVFDFLHEIMNCGSFPNSYVRALSKAFDEEQLAYKLLSDESIIVPRISGEEGKAFGDALEKVSLGRFDGAKSHLVNAAKHLRDDKSADSIRDSIHAVESVLRILTDEKSGDFSKALKKLAPEIGLHPALKSGFDSMYGFTCDQKGVRHCLLDADDETTSDDAIFMLSSCASMISYFINKYDRKVS